MVSVGSGAGIRTHRQLRWMALAEWVAWRLLELNCSRAAEDVLDSYREPGGSSFSWGSLALSTVARHMLGGFQAELESGTLGLEQLPAVAQFCLAKARALAAMGQIAAVEEVIDEFLRVQTHGEPAGALMSDTAMGLRA